ncbi:hypothetical protein [Mesorhizobium sp. B2-8-9]|uniref:hypothetical protein n=1 Tax=Mesorhizobium sp. B2-8-9 TaxID=2589899 RepID=UPI0015E43BDD|nr:hypothetical protein [Mesorhizobium sp. B2-8-9]
MTVWTSSGFQPGKCHRRSGNLGFGGRQIFGERHFIPHQTRRSAPGHCLRVFKTIDRAARAADHVPRYGPTLFVVVSPAWQAVHFLKTVFHASMSSAEAGGAQANAMAPAKMAIGCLTDVS